MAQYKPLKGETLYDVAVKLYAGDAVAGIRDLLYHNPTIDLDAEDLFSLTLTYTPSILRKKPVFITETPIRSLPYKTLTKQSVYDLSIQLYGDLSKIGKLLKLFPNLDDVITLGSSVSVEEQTDPQAVFFAERGLIVATDIENTNPDLTVDNLLLEGGDNILLENEDLILLE